MRQSTQSLSLRTCPLSTTPRLPLALLACCIAAAAAAATTTTTAAAAPRASPPRVLPLRGGIASGMASASIAASSAGTLYLIGLGLGDEKDITVKGLETVRRCKAVFLEAYTSILGVDKERVEDFYGCKISLMDREAVEQECDTMLDMARTDEVAFLVVGDVYGATTHTDIAVRARDLGITVKVLFYILDACTFMTYTTRGRTQTETQTQTQTQT